MSQYQGDAIIRTTTPLSDAGESTCEGGGNNNSSSTEDTLQQQQQQMNNNGGGTTSQSSNINVNNNNHMTKAAHDAIFGRPGSTVSHRTTPPISNVALSSTQHLLTTQDVNNGDELDRTWPTARSSQIRDAINSQQQHNAQGNGRSPRLIPHLPPSNNVPPTHIGGSLAQQQQPVAPPTALSIMRRRRSNSNELSNSLSKSKSREKMNLSRSRDRLSLSTSSGRNREAEKKNETFTLDGSGSGGKPPKSSTTAAATSQEQQQQRLQTLQNQQQQIYDSMMAAAAANQQQTAMRYNASLHSTIGGYPMGTPTQLTHPSVTMELIARDRARWEADYYNNHNQMDYEYNMDYGRSHQGRGDSMSTPGGRVMQPQTPQGSYQPVRNQQRGTSSSMPYVGIGSTSSPQRGRVLQERDYKNGRVWQEDDHTTRTFSSTSRSPKPERRQSGKTSNRERDEQEDQVETDVESPKLPPVPKLREDSEAALPSQYSQQGTLPQGLLQGHRGVPQGRGGDVPMNDYSQYHPSAGMIPPSYYQANLPSTPVRNRERQISDISSVAGSVGGPVPVVYPDGTYGLIYPPTPGGSTVGYELAQNPGLYQYDPRQMQQQGVMPWMNPHLYPIPTQASNRVANEEISHAKEGEAVSNAAAASSNDHAPSSNPRASLRSSRRRSNPSRSVSFSNLEIRTYETILGDNPSCSAGPSLSIGWRYDPNHDSISIDDYEAHQARINGLPPGSTYACRPEELVLHRSEREDILLSSGYTRQDFVESIRSMKKIKSKRRQTVNNLPVMYFEERVESAKRTLRRFFKRTQRTRHIYEDWKEKSVQGR